MAADTKTRMRTSRASTGCIRRRPHRSECPPLERQYSDSDSGKNGFRPAGRNPFLPLSESEYCRSSGGHSERCGRRRMQPVEARDVRILVFVSAAMSGRPFPPFRFRSACLPTFGSSSVFGAVESSAGRSPSVSTGGDGTKENVLRSVRMQDVCRNVRNAYFAAFFLS